MGTSGRLDQINFGSIMWSPAINITVLRAAFFLPNCAGHLGTNSLAILVTHPLFYLIYVPLHQVMVKSFVAVSAAFIQLILLAQVSTGLPISPTTGAPESQALSKRNEEHQLFKRHMSGGTITTGEIVGCALVGGIILTAGVLGACNRWHDKIPFTHLSKATKPRIPDVEMGRGRAQRESGGRPTTRINRLPPARPLPAARVGGDSVPSESSMAASHAAYEPGSSGPTTDHHQNDGLPLSSSHSQGGELSV